MKIEIRKSGAAFGALEEMYLRSTLGAAIRHDRPRIERIVVEIAPLPTEGGCGHRCRIEVHTERGPLRIERSGVSEREAFMRATDDLDRALFAHFWEPCPCDAQEGLAA